MEDKQEATDPAENLLFKGPGSGCHCGHRPAEAWRTSDQELHLPGDGAVAARAVCTLPYREVLSECPVWHS